MHLVNKGRGENYGIEATLERFFSNGYYFLINGSLFESKYKALDGIWRSTKFNSNYIGNVLAGKEFDKLGKKQNRVLAVNAKFVINGGQRYIPLLRGADGNLAVDPASSQFWDYSKSYSSKLDVLYHLDLSLSYKINRPKATHEIFIDLPNVSSHEGRISEYYNAGKVAYITQMPLLPNLMYRVYF